MTSHSLVPMSARAAGISYEDLCLKLVDQRHARSPRRYTSPMNARYTHMRPRPEVDTSVVVPFGMRRPCMWLRL
jgi:hypothetical protein